MCSSDLDALFELRGEPTTETLARLATDQGLDAQPILDHMSSPEVQAVIDANYALAEQLGITGTPAFLLEGAPVMRGYAPLDVMRDVVAQARAEG